MEKTIHGIIPPSVTPLNEDGSVDIKGLEAVIAHGLKGQVDGFFVLGSCGEGSCLGRAERSLLVREALNILGGRVPLMAGVLESSAQRAIDEIHRLELLGVRYFVVTPPFYLDGVSQNQILEHYRLIHDSTEGQLIVYNIPPYVHCHVLPETMARIAGLKRVCAVKDSTDQWALMQKALLMKADRKTSFLCGNEDLGGAALLWKADGCVPCLANIYPDFYHAMLETAKAGDVGKVKEYQSMIIEAKSVLAYGDSWVSSVKYLCSRKGLIKEFPAPGLPRLNREQKYRIDNVISRVEERMEAYR